MFDTVNLENKGIPAVALINDRFKMVAQSQAKIAGLSSAKIVPIPEPHPGEPSEELSAKIDLLWDNIVEALVSGLG